jgi:hypothetical protein
MYSLGFLIIELETARKRLLHVFDLPEGKTTRELRTQIIPRGCTESTFSRVISSARSAMRFDLEESYTRRGKASTSYNVIT